jgi:hypothetical protein
MDNGLEDWLEKIRQNIAETGQKEMSPEKRQRRIDAIAKIEQHTAFVNAERIRANADAYMLYLQDPTRYIG